MEFEILQLEELKYLIRYPENYTAGQKYPVLIFLHGAGTRGSDINILKENIFFESLESIENFPFIVVAPQCSAETWFDMFEQLKKLVLSVVSQNFADKEKIYLMGTSMGGYGTWQLTMSMPEIFAAIVPICGGGMYWNAGRLKNVPVWAFHGGKDRVVYLEESQKMVDAVNRFGGNAKLTVYPENDHNAWTDTYTNPEVFEWLLSNTNKNGDDQLNRYNDSKLYG